MSSPSSVIYVVTGANRARGLGFALVSHILATHENAFVYAGVRDPSSPGALEYLQKKYPERLEISKCISADSASNLALAKGIENRHGKVDTVIANAAMSHGTGTAKEIPTDCMKEHFEVNALGPLVLFQAMYKLLQNSTNPRFIPISSIGGSIGGPGMAVSAGVLPYCTAKAALNWLTRKIHFENEWLVAFPLSPGGVATDLFIQIMDNDPSGYLREMCEKGQVTTAAEVAPTMLKIIDNSTRQNEGGQFVDVKRTRLPW